MFIMAKNKAPIEGVLPLLVLLLLSVKFWFSSTSNRPYFNDLSKAYTL